MEEEREGVSEERENVGKMGMAWDYFVMSPDQFHGSGLGEIDEELEEEEDKAEEGIARRHNEEDEFKTPEKVAKTAVVEEEEEEVVVVMETPPPPPPEIGMKQFVHSNTAPADVEKVSSKGETENVNVGGNGGGTKVNLMKVLEEIDEYFLKASECAQEVTKLLEAHKLQYHSSYADNRGSDSILLTLLFDS